MDDNDVIRRMRAERKNWSLSLFKLQDGHSDDILNIIFLNRKETNQPNIKQRNCFNVSITKRYQIYYVTLNNIIS